MMKVKFSIFVLFIVPSIIYSAKISKYFPKQVEKMNKLAANEATSTINGAVKLKEDGFLGDGGFGFVYEGTIIKDNRSVAIKFVAKSNLIESEREFYTFVKLFAYQTPETERLGIPVVYYRGQWKNFTLTAITKLDKNLFDLIDEEHHLKNPLDVLILIRNFIFQSKYMHRNGVRHDDITPGNIMVKGYKSFIIDYNQSSKMAKDNKGCTMIFASRRWHKEKNRLAIDDFESFLFSMLYILQLPLKMFLPRSPFNQLFENRFYKNCKQKTDNISRCINENVKDEALKTVLNEFINDVLTDDRSKAFPNYNHLYEMAERAIASKHDNDSTFPPIFSWLSEAEKLEAKQEIDSNPRLNIKRIDEPSSINFEKFIYPSLTNPPRIDL